MAASYFPRSTFVSEVDYDSKARVLRIVMNGRAYNYQNVSRFQWYRLRKAVSVGRYYNRAIKSKRPWVPDGVVGSLYSPVMA